MGLVFQTIISLVIGLAPQIDNFCHVGGFYFGVLAGLCVFVTPDFDPKTGEELPISSKKGFLKMVGFIAAFISMVTAQTIMVYYEVHVKKNNHQRADRTNPTPGPNPRFSNPRSSNPRSSNPRPSSLSLSLSHSLSLSLTSLTSHLALHHYGHRTTLSSSARSATTSRVMRSQIRRRWSRCGSVALATRRVSTLHMK